MIETERENYDGSQLAWLPEAARAEHLRDHGELSGGDPGVEAAIDSGVAWLCLAQDGSLSHDGGVADLYSLIEGWGSSYPETTGYIIPTFLTYAKLRSDNTVRERARRMLDWLVSIQFPDGSFQGGTISAEPKLPTVFNTGQILIGLAAGVREFGDEYFEPMRRAADWLVKVQEPDGSWRKFESPFVDPGEKTYCAHVAWGLLEATRVAPDRYYAEAALANLHWTVSEQNAVGWFAKCDFDNPDQPLTHTLAYAWRGVLEGYVFARDSEFLVASQKAADGFLRAMQVDGFIPGRVRSDWRAAVEWACLTGSAQIVHCWLLLYQLTGEERYRDAGYLANSYVRRLVRTTGPPEVVGAVKGSFPIDGDYCEYSYVNWACKFFVDANMLEREIRAAESKD